MTTFIERDPRTRELATQSVSHGTVNRALKNLARHFYHDLKFYRRILLNKNITVLLSLLWALRLGLAEDRVNSQKHLKVSH